MSVKIVFYAIVLAALQGLSCSTDREVNASAEQPASFTVILDLSDRLLQPNQPMKDMAAITAVFQAFVRKVEQNMFIKSRDRFSVRIIRQGKSKLEYEAYGDSLSINLADYRLGEKKLKIIDFEKRLPGMLDRLYRNAMIGKASRDFEGVDIWQYFNEHVSTDIAPAYRNTVIILTDGYFDFNNMRDKVKSGNRSTTTDFLPKITGATWEKNASDYGLIPVRLPKNVRWLVCGINSKNPGDQLMNVKLAFFWKKWLQESTGENVADPIVSSSPEKLRSLLQGILG